jgi:hypothetical protein
VDAIPSALLQGVAQLAVTYEPASIREVNSIFSVTRRTLEILGIKPSTFYRWYDRFRSGGPEPLQDKPSFRKLLATEREGRGKSQTKLPVFVLEYIPAAFVAGVTRLL